ncbi:hypothetical protein L210DRAFT_2505713 [Boletus edulis BED1]|uniref:DUF6533 domain-containing protein n=1 Tax=Boletus edulis BED1 TaxID=1328754 RepID=A0AAD4GC87_BOLED|nr:hypothetical protein L210DRAFT_2505713 [Boletus edulis BED1]
MDPSLLSLPSYMIIVSGAFTSVHIRYCSNVTAVLTFSKEIDYIWCRPWTLVSTLFVVVRYIGFCWMIAGALVYNSFNPDRLEVSKALYLVSYWTSIVFLFAADVVMILRVYAMWNRSRTILFILLFFYALQIISSVVFDGIYENPDTYFSVTIVRVLDFSFCSDSFVNIPPLHQVYTAAPRFVLGTALIVLAVFRSLKQTMEMYTVTKQWQPNRYMEQLVRDGTLYFFAYVPNCPLYTLPSPPC